MTFFKYFKDLIKDMSFPLNIPQWFQNYNFLHAFWFYKGQKKFRWELLGFIIFLFILKIESKYDFQSVKWQLSIRKEGQS